MYIDSTGFVRKVSKVQRARDRWRGFWGGIKKGKVDHFTDHSMDGYITCINKSARQEKEGKLDPKTAAAVDAAVKANQSA